MIARFSYRITFIPSATLVLVACAAVSTPPRLTETEARRFVDAHVSKDFHYDLREFQPRKARYVSERDSWYLYYRRKSGGAELEVRLYDKTRKLEFTFIDYSE
jgi:hypothetical protein